MAMQLKNLVLYFRNILLYLKIYSIVVKMSLLLLFMLLGRSNVEFITAPDFVLALVNYCAIF